MRAMQYCPSPFLFQRRKTREVVIGDPSKGGVIIGGDHPIVKQSMLTCDTMDTTACVQQTLDLVNVGCELVRITAPTVKDSANLQNIVAELRRRDCHVPIVADIHFHDLHGRVERADKLGEVHGVGFDERVRIDVSFERQQRRAVRPLDFVPARILVEIKRQLRGAIEHGFVDAADVRVRSRTKCIAPFAVDR